MYYIILSPVLIQGINPTESVYHFLILGFLLVQERDKRNDQGTSVAANSQSVDL